MALTSRALWCRSVLALIVLTSLLLGDRAGGFVQSGSIESMAPATRSDAQPSILAVYAIPADGTAAQASAAGLRASLESVQQWFVSQTGGTYPVMRKTNGSIDVVEHRLTLTAAEIARGSITRIDPVIVADILRSHPITDGSTLLIALEAETGNSHRACAYTPAEHPDLGHRFVMLPTRNCRIDLTASSWPTRTTFALAHELTHLLGGANYCGPNHVDNGHVDDSPDDIVSASSIRSLRQPFVLDVGNDDYFRHGMTGCPDIEDNPLLGVWGEEVAGPKRWCAGRQATIIGGPGNDVLHGTEGSDVIVALSGDDVIYGLGGNDVICAGTGDDLVYAGAGADLVLGSRGADRLAGGPGNDRIRAGSGNDATWGDVGRDRIHGGSGADTLRGGPGQDIVEGGAGSDDVIGGSGRDDCRTDASDRVRRCE